MPIRIPKQTIRLVRDGENVTPDIGEPFDFTADELADINAVNPDAIRKPIDETSTPAKGGKKGKAVSGDEGL